MPLTPRQAQLFQLAADGDECALADLFKEANTTLNTTMNNMNGRYSNNKPPLVSEHVANIIAERSAVYGPPIRCFQAIADSWTALLGHAFGQPLPRALNAKEVALMMVEWKALRATQKFNSDNFA